MEKLITQFPVPAEQYVRTEHELKRKAKERIINMLEAKIKDLEKSIPKVNTPSKKSMKKAKRRSGKQKHPSKQAKQNYADTNKKRNDKIVNNENDEASKTSLNDIYRPMSAPETCDTTDNNQRDKEDLTPEKDAKALVLYQGIRRDLSSFSMGPTLHILNTGFSDKAVKIAPVQRQHHASRQIIVSRSDVSVIQILLRFVAFLRYIRCQNMTAKELIGDRTNALMKIDENRRESLFGVNIEVNLDITGATFNVIDSHMSEISQLVNSMKMFVMVKLITTTLRQMSHSNLHQKLVPVQYRDVTPVIEAKELVLYPGIMRNFSSLSMRPTLLNLDTVSALQILSRFVAFLHHIPCENYKTAKELVGDRTNALMKIDENRRESLFNVTPVIEAKELVLYPGIMRNFFSLSMRPTLPNLDTLSALQILLRFVAFLHHVPCENYKTAKELVGDRTNALVKIDENRRESLFRFKVEVNIDITDATEAMIEISQLVNSMKLYVIAKIFTTAIRQLSEFHQKLLPLQYKEENFQDLNVLYDSTEFYVERRRQDMGSRDDGKLDKSPNVTDENTDETLKASQHMDIAELPDNDDLMKKLPGTGPGATVERTFSMPSVEFTAGKDEYVANAENDYFDDDDDDGYYGGILGVYCRSEIHADYSAGHSFLDVGQGNQSGSLQSSLPELPTERCCNHKAKVLDMYCQKHDQVGCCTCMATDHRSCPDSQIFSVPDMLDTLYNLSESQHTQRRLQQMMVSMKTLSESKESRLESLQKAKAEVIDQIAKFQNALEAVFKKAADSSRKEVTEAYKNLEKGILQDKCTIDNTNDILQDTDDKLNKAATNRAQRFVCSKEAEKNIKEAEQEKMKQETEDTTDVEISFRPNIKLMDYIQGLHGIGDVLVAKKKRSDLYKLKDSRDINIKSSNDAYTCRSFGCCLMHDNQLLVTDLDNQKVKLFATNTMTIIDICSLDGRPIGICCINQKEAVVACRDPHTIQFVFIEDKITLTRKIDTSHVCYGIAIKDDNIYITDEETSLYVYDMNGTIINDNGGNKLFSSTRNIVFNESGNRMFVCDVHKGLVCFDGMGNYLSNTKDNDLGDVYGVSTDGRGNIFVASYSSNNVVQYNEDGEKTGVVIKQEDKLEGPLSMYFSQGQNRLFVTMDESDILKMYDLE
ncbi:hypothetical protein ACF0H5_021980 [Mactra antiquata]